MNLISTVNMSEIQPDPLLLLARQNIWGVESSTRRSLVSFLHLQTSSQMYLIGVSGDDFRRFPEHLLLSTPFDIKLNVTFPYQLNSCTYQSVCRRFDARRHR